jgi:hypothetical protein
MTRDEITARRDARLERSADAHRAHAVGRAASGDPGARRPRRAAHRSAGAAPPETVASLERAAKERLGPGIEVQVEIVPDIPLDANGKFQVSRSHVQSFDRPVERERDASPR